MSSDDPWLGNLCGNLWPVSLLCPICAQHHRYSPVHFLTFCQQLSLSQTFLIFLIFTNRLQISIFELHLNEKRQTFTFHSLLFVQFNMKIVIPFICWRCCWIIFNLLSKIRKRSAFIFRSGKIIIFIYVVFLSANMKICYNFAYSAFSQTNWETERTKISQKMAWESKSLVKFRK